jgi:predicted amidohydrolase YtcJ
MTAREPHPHPQQILTSECVIPMARGEQEIHSVAIAGGRIVAVGGRELLDRHPGCEVLDFGERPILPGFVDSHVHYEIESVSLETSVPIHTPPCESIEDIIDVLRENLSWSERRGGWLIGEGNLMQDQRLKERRVPNRLDLDRVSTKVPIALRIGGHTTAMNSRALELLDFEGAFKLPRGAVLERDERGALTGVAREVFYHLPIPLPSGEELREILKAGMRRAFTQFGVTTIGEIPRTLEAVELMESMTNSGELPCRVRTFLRPGPMGPPQDLIEYALARAGSGDPDRYRAQGIKLFADGGLSAATAATLRDYAIRPGSKGRLAYTAKELRHLLESIVSSSLQPMVHAVGERGQIAVCDAISSLGIDGPLPPRLRPRLEHAGNFVSGRRVIDAWERSGMLPVPNIVMLYSFGAYMPRYLGPYGEHGRFPLRMMAEEGWRLASGSDITGDEPQATNPMFGIWTAVARRSVTGELIEPEQALTVEQALRMYTIDAAAALGDEETLGSIEAGKQADIVVLERDPRAVPVEELRDIKTDLVMLAGRVVHERPGHGARPIADVGSH